MSTEWPSIADVDALSRDEHALYALYARMHAEAPVRWDERALGMGCWTVAPHAEVAALLRDPRLSADRSGAYRFFLPPTEEGTLVGDTMAGLLAFKDPPDHTRLRGLVSKAFTPRAVEAMRPRVEAIVTELVDEIVAAGGETELMSRFAYPLPVAVICEMLGLPREDVPRIAPWLEDFVRFFGAMRGLKRVLASARELRSYFDALFAERRANPRDDLLTALVEAEQDKERLSADELFQTVVFLFAAGHHTTTNLIGNGVLALLRHPDELARLRAHPELTSNAIEEMLRYDPAVQMVARLARQPLTVRDRRVEAGQLLLLVVGAANRDPAVFDRPDTLSVTRDNASKHVAFGIGPHFCLGAALARLEARVAFDALLGRFREWELGGPLVWTENFTLRGLESLPLRLRAA